MMQAPPTDRRPEESPAIDVVVPSLNCADSLRRCLTRVVAQDYAGTLNLVVVDGGSRDQTVEVARSFGAQVFVNPGQYSAGLDGARHFGESKGRSPLVWNLDADNYLVEPNCASALVRPLVDHPDLSFSFPSISVDPSDNRLNGYLSLDELDHLDELRARCHPVGAVFVTEDCPYGLTNATLIRRTALERAGGYDSDFLLLARLRALGLARAAFVPGVHFTHSQAHGLMEYRRKWLKRARLYAAMGESERARYFFASSAGLGLGSQLEAQASWSLLRGPFRAVRRYLGTGDPTWLYGPMVGGAVLSIALLHPVLTRKALSSFLVGRRSPGN